MLDFISSLFSFHIWLAIPIIIVSVFFMRISLEGEGLRIPKSWTTVFFIAIILFSSICAIQRYSSSRELAYPMNFFDSYENIQNHENFRYNIMVYEEDNYKQVRVHDKDNDLNFDFVVKNDADATIEYVNKYFFE